MMAFLLMLAYLYYLISLKVVGSGYALLEWVFLMGWLLFYLAILKEAKVGVIIPLIINVIIISNTRLPVILSLYTQMRLLVV